jgi:hypothetical protein
VALEPVLFPDLEGPEFVQSDEVARVAGEVLARHGGWPGIGRLRETARALENGRIAIAYLENTKAFNPVVDDVTHDAIAKCIKAPALWHDVTGIDVIVWIRSYFWKMFDDRQRAAVVLHELLHVALEEKDDELRLRLRDHDVEEFIDVMRWYGALDVGREQLVRAYGLYHEDGGKPKADETSVEVRSGDRVVTLDAEARRRLDRRAKRSRRDDPRDEGEQAADRGDPEAES